MARLQHARVAMLVKKMFYGALLAAVLYGVILFAAMRDAAGREPPTAARGRARVSAIPQASARGRARAASISNAYDVCVVGAGLSGAVIAQQYASKLNKTVLVVEKRDHIGGNCYDYTDEETGIRVNRYGAHLFHTKHARVWRYVQAFATWVPYEHKVQALVDGKYVPVPVNIDSVNILFGLNISGPAQMRAWLHAEQRHLPAPPRNSEEVSLSRVGPRLYEKLFKPYTIKQWAKTPAQLGPEVMARIPVRTSHDARYFSDRWQALPAHGYTAFFENLLGDPRITVETGTDFFAVRGALRCGRTYFTGPVDAYFAHLGWPRLEYRSLTFAREVHAVPLYQPISVVNHPSPAVPYTRVVEYKHFLGQRSNKTVIFKEFSQDAGEPYYPVPSPANQALFAKYKAMADSHTNVSFVGRLANYKYFNMDESILNALELFDRDTGAGAGERAPRTSSDLVIAHCTEDLSWIPAWIAALHLSRVYVYTKCGAQVPRGSAVVRVTPLANKGREGQSWLHHLLRTDIVFADQSVFVQGSPEVTLAAVRRRLGSRGHRFIDFGTQSPSTYAFPGCVTSHSAIEGELRARYQEWKPPASNASFESIHCTLRGEFSVSRAAIQGFLRRHTRPRLERLKQETEAGNAPAITYVLERLWGVLFSSE